MHRRRLGAHCHHNLGRENTKQTYSCMRATSTRTLRVVCPYRTPRVSTTTSNFWLNDRIMLHVFVSLVILYNMYNIKYYVYKLCSASYLSVFVQRNRMSSAQSAAIFIQSQSVPAWIYVLCLLYKYKQYLYICCVVFTPPNTVRAAL